MRRVVVFGTTGSGKSWLAEQLATRLGLRVIELDALYWGPDWQGASPDLFRYRVENETRPLADDPGWIVAGNYSHVRDLVWRPADTLIWLDLPFALVFRRLLVRTIRRRLRRENLWGTGNRESFLRTFFTRQSILWWAIKTHRRNRERFASECALWGKDKIVVRLRSAREVERFLATA